MIISNGSALARHSKNGKLLNKWNDKDQDHIAVLFTEPFTTTFQQNEIAVTVVNDYKLKKPKTRAATLDLLWRIVLRLVIAKERLLTVPRSNTYNVKRKTVETLVNWLESEELIIAYQGFGLGNGLGGRPKAFKATNKLLNYCEKVLIIKRKAVE